MSDLVERLRGHKIFWLNGGAWMMGTDPDPDCAEAAAEIERLTADNHKLMLWNEQLQAELDIARRALEGK